MGNPATSPTIRPPDPHLRAPAIPLPPGSCDCHAHVFGPADRFPYAPTRAYTPVDTPTPMYVAQLRALGCERAVLVQPSCYGTDNTAMLDALRSGSFPFRGVAVISGHEPDEELEAMHAAGVRGIRLNLYTRGALLSLDDAQRLAARVRPFGWHLQIYASLSTLSDLDGLLDRLDRPVVIDHLGHPDVAAGPQAPGFRALLRALADGRCWVKLSGAYRLTQRHPRYPEALPFARALVAANPERLVWGSDWPHTNFAGPMPNDAELADLLCEWAPDDTVRHRILVDNPARLYDFP
ncbi:MAG: amidohydrolase family protein [Pseudomonadota bacterium]|jgi:predicted TIM-barrel fold metal-dependent hydrolase